MDNHYHTIGYLGTSANLGPSTERFHGSVAKLVNDTSDDRLVPLWKSGKGHDYFDGCLPDATQCRRAYRYMGLQCRRAAVCADPLEYPHPRAHMNVEWGVARAVKLDAFLPDMPYALTDDERQRRVGQGRPNAAHPVCRTVAGRSAW